MKLRTKLLGGAAAVAALATPIAVMASSHREAPFITKSPKVDGTDFYMFNSYDPLRTGTVTGGTLSNQYVTLLANYLPAQDGAGGPNFYGMDPDAIYEISIDNNGDAKEDLTFQFQFSQALAGSGAGIALQIGPSGGTMNVAIPFSSIGSPGNLGTALGTTPFTTDSAAGQPGRNVFETYTVTEIVGDRRTGITHPVLHTGMTGSAAAVFDKPVDNIGSNTIANYNTYANSFIFDVDINGCTPPAAAGGDTHPHPRVFVGQRKEAFAVNLGQIFDTVSLQASGGVPTATGAGTQANVLGALNQGNGQYNTLANKNVTTIALEIPASCLTNSASAHPQVIAGWTTASVRQARVINPTPTFTTPSKEGGAWAQVSRLSMPLVNEVVIGLPDKDKFNSSVPSGDGQFANYVEYPTLPTVLATIYGGAGGLTAPTNFPRTDLVAVFLNGVAGFNADGSTAELQRLNTNYQATALASQTFPYGAVGCFDAPTATADAVLNPSNHIGGATSNDCDPAGFPNGRRPGDDVVDIALRVVMGALVHSNAALSLGCIHTVTTTTSAGIPNLAFDNSKCLTYGDGANIAASTLPATFPYLNAPVGGAP